MYAISQRCSERGGGGSSSSDQCNSAYKNAERRNKGTDREICVTESDPDEGKNGVSYGRRCRLSLT